MSKPLSPYQRIMRNAQKGRGVRLSAEEVFQLSLDNAIETRAELDDDGALRTTSTGKWLTDAEYAGRAGA